MWDFFRHERSNADVFGNKIAQYLDNLSMGITYYESQGLEQIRTERRGRDVQIRHAERDSWCADVCHDLAAHTRILVRFSLRSRTVVLISMLTIFKSLRISRSRTTTRSLRNSRVMR